MAWASHSKEAGFRVGASKKPAFQESRKWKQIEGYLQNWHCNLCCILLAKVVPGPAQIQGDGEINMVSSWGYRKSILGKILRDRNTVLLVIFVKDVQVVHSLCTCLSLDKHTKCMSCIFVQVGQPVTLLEVSFNPPNLSKA